jgi:hypothetical protein
MPTRGPQPTLTELLAGRSRRLDSGCLEWTGYIDDRGYGRLFQDGRMLLVHRLSWEAASGQTLPRGAKVRWTCSNRACIEPSHLQPSRIPAAVRRAVTIRIEPSLYDRLCAAAQRDRRSATAEISVLLEAQLATRAADGC